MRSATLPSDISGHDGTGVARLPTMAQDDRSRLRTSDVGPDHSGKRPANPVDKVRLPDRFVVPARRREERRYRAVLREQRRQILRVGAHLRLVQSAKRVQPERSALRSLDGGDCNPCKRILAATR